MSPRLPKRWSARTRNRFLSPPSNERQICVTKCAISAQQSISASQSDQFLLRMFSEKNNNLHYAVNIIILLPVSAQNSTGFKQFPKNTKFPNQESKPPCGSLRCKIRSKPQEIYSIKDKKHMV